jgi:hypothetical protein
MKRAQLKKKGSIVHIHAVNVGSAPVILKLYGGEWLTSRPRRFTPRGKRNPVPIK